MLAKLLLIAAVIEGLIKFYEDDYPVAQVAHLPKRVRV